MSTNKKRARTNSGVTRWIFFSILTLSICMLWGPHTASTQVDPLNTKIVGSEVIHKTRASHDLVKLHMEYQAHMQAAPGQPFVTTDIALPIRGNLVVVDAVAEGNAKVLLQSLEALGL
ncbi:MAG: hypothetical protein JSW58_03205, partial [Candidatus Latescibacterota bacterium]